MASITSCSLCSFFCDEFKCLFDDNGRKSEVYEVAVKYFHSSLLNSGTEITTLKVICLECWQHISDFHSFQQWVLNAQIEQEDLKHIVHKEKSDDDDISTFDIIKSNAIDGKEEIHNEDNSDDKDTVIEKLKGKLECYKCKNKFSSFSTLEIHFQQLHPQEQLYVICCKETYSKSSSLVEHLLVAHKQIKVNPFKCESCGASFSQYCGLRRHVRGKHFVQPLLKWTCRYCNKLFRNRLHLERHKQKMHTKQMKKGFPRDLTQNANEIKNDKYLDDIDVDSESEEMSHQKENQHFANQIYIKEETVDSNDIELDLPTSSNDLNSAIQIQVPALDIMDVKKEELTDSEGEEDPISKITISDIEEHDLSLTQSKRNLECPKCHKNVYSYDQLKDHFNLQHPDERCYINCCHITLYERASIVEHLKFHENPKTFECNDCGKCFRSSKGLASHKLQVHSDNRFMLLQKSHLCYCKRARELQKENNQQQSLAYDTTVCCQRKKKILDDDALIAKWKKNVICEICKTFFPYYSLMRSHFYREHPGEKFYISCCRRKISRISDALNHIRFHLDPNAYRCKICDVSCSSKSCLSKHMRNNHSDFMPKHKWACDECDKTFEMRQILTRHKNCFHSKQV